MKNLIIAEEAVQEGFDLPHTRKDGADAAERGAVLRDLIAVVRFFMTSDWMIAKHHNESAAGSCCICLQFSLRLKPRYHSLIRPQKISAFLRRFSRSIIS